MFEQEAFPRPFGALENREAPPAGLDHSAEQSGKLLPDEQLIERQIRAEELHARLKLRGDAEDKFLNEMIQAELSPRPSFAVEKAAEKALARKSRQIGGDDLPRLREKLADKLELRQTACDVVLQVGDDFFVLFIKLQYESHGDAAELEVVQAEAPGQLKQRKLRYIAAPDSVFQQQFGISDFLGLFLRYRRECRNLRPLGQVVLKLLARYHKAQHVGQVVFGSDPCVVFVKQVNAQVHHAV